MKNKHLFILVCLLTLLVLVLSACGGGGSSTTAVTGTPPTATTSTTAGQTTTATSTTTASQTTTTTTAAGNSISSILGKWSGTGSVKFDMSMTITGQPTVKITMWQKNQKMREDMTMEGVITTIIFDQDAKVMYTYMPALKMAYKTTLTSAMIPQGNVENTSAILDYNPNITGTETIDGKSCTVISYDTGGSGSVKEWIWTEKGFPLKMEMNTSAGTTTIEYSNIDFSDIPDSAFELPEDVTITDMGT